MPLPLPDLDDRTYADLVTEALALIPTYAPDWTNHNASDPGITLVELFAYLTEMLIYRVNRVTDANMLAFLRLLNGPAWSPQAGKALDEQVRETVLLLRQPNRAVTCADFESLALAAHPGVARAVCLPQRDLENAAGLDQTKAGHISVVIVPYDQATSAQPPAELRETVRNSLEARRLLTTWVHVVGPRYFPLAVRFSLVLTADAVGETVRARAEDRLRTYLDPLAGGPDGEGWPFGRHVFVSELYELLDGLPGVDYVLPALDPATGEPLEELAMNPAEAARLERNARGELVGVRLAADELVDARNSTYALTVISPLAG